MFKRRFYLGKLAMIVACLAVTAMFSTCDKKNDDDNGNGDGKFDAKLIGTWTSNGKPLHYRLVDGKWVLNTGGEQGFGYGYIFNSDGTYIFMISLTDIAGQYLGTGINRGIFRTDEDKLILTLRYYDFVSRNRDKDTSNTKTGEEIYYFSFGVKHSGWGEGLILQPEDMNISDSFFFPLE